ncbi:MAG: DUF1192 domain-containing protein [Caulobacteraceae bacterium]
MEEPAPPRPQRGASLEEAVREDLEIYAVDELNDRIVRLEAEIQRTRKVLDRKRSGRSAADALFSFGP